MPSEKQVKQLVEEIFESERTPEEVCAAQPELLPDVLKWLDRLKRTELELERLFPSEWHGDAVPIPGVGSKLPSIDGYEVHSVLGLGGMGIVFGALHLATNRKVAIKMLRFGAYGGTLELERFSQEYKLLAQLNHPRIVHVYSVGTTAGQPYFSMEFVPGETLEAILAQGPQNSVYAATIVEKLADAVSAAHQQGIIHRDLKPSNVLLTAGQEPKVSDFGLARDADDGLSLTMSGIGVGTPSYMAPEQAAGRNRDISTSVDIYALGAILYQLLTGRPPFRGESRIDTIQQVISLEPVPPSQLNAKVHRDLETICLKCLEKEPGKRYPTAQVLGERLRQFIDGKPIPDRPIGNVERSWRWCRRNPPLASVVGLSLFLVVALVVSSVVFGIQQGKISDQLRSTLQESQRQKALSTWDYARQLCVSGEIGHGLLILAKALESVPLDEGDLRKAMEIELAGWHSQCHTLQQIFAHPKKVLAIGVSPDGKSCATACADGLIRICHLDSGESQEFARLEDEPLAIKFSTDGRVIITGGTAGQIILWDVTTSRQIATLTGHTAEICAISVSSDRDHVLTGGMDHDARLWHLPSRSCKTTFHHAGPVLTVAFSPDGSTIFTGGGAAKDGEFRLYRTHQQESVMPLLRAPKNGLVRSGAFSPNGKTLVVGDADWETSFWDVESRNQFAVVDYSHGTVCGIDFAPIQESGSKPPDETVLLVTDESRLGMFWNVTQLRAQWESQHDGSLVLAEHKRPLPSLPTVLHPEGLTAVSFVPPLGDRFLTASNDGYVRLWKRAPGLQQKMILRGPEQKKPLWATDISPSGILVATAGDSGKLNFWNVAQSEPIGKPLDCRGAVKSVAFSSDETTVITGNKEGRLRSWDIQTGIESTDSVQNAGGISAFSISQDGKSILVGGGGRAQLWSIAPFQRVGSPLQHDQTNSELSIGTAVSPNQDRYLTFGEDGLGRLWNNDGTSIAILEHQNEVRSGVFSRDGRLAITSSDDKKVRVWDSATGSLISTLTHQSEVYAVAVAEGSKIVTGSRDGAQIWDVTLQRRLGPPCVTGNDVMSISCTSDGKTAVIGDWNGNGTIWALPEPLGVEPQHLTKWVQTELGMQLDEGGGRQVISGKSWLQLRRPLHE